MKDGNSKKSKKLVRKWFNVKSKIEESQADEAVYREKSLKNIERSRLSPMGRGYLDHPQTIYRLFVSTWNVEGRSPTSNVKLDDLLHSAHPADIYVLGFQEIIPLNAGNILVAEDNGAKWLSLINRTLNNAPGSRGGIVCYTTANFEGLTRNKASTCFPHQSFRTPQCWRRKNETCAPQPSDYSSGSSPSDYSQASDYAAFALAEYTYSMQGHSRYSLVASKQMVGLFLTVWVRSELTEHVQNVKVSCVGRGLMGYLDKGSISISMLLHQTSLCFVCSHLASGQKEGDELLRNVDFMEILRKTRFPRVNGVNEEKSPETILEHDRILLLGDLNYRIALPYRSAKALMEKNDWNALMEKDQLRIEQRRGRAFDGWREGNIYFPPTYKYSHNSDRYAGDDIHPEEKRRTPGWCDRILWYGGGLQQLSYVRGESRFSDHRPVSSLFLVEIESASDRLIKSVSYSSSRMEAEELLPNVHKYTELNFF